MSTRAVGMDSGLRWAFAGFAATAFFTFFALAFPDASRTFTIPGAFVSFGLGLLFLWPEVRGFHARRKRRVIALIGMIVCAAGLGGFGLWYLWPVTEQKHADASPQTAKPWKHSLEDLYASDFADLAAPSDAGK